MNKDILVRLLLILAIALVVAAALTLVPYAGASKPNIMGFKSLCTFTPASTAILLLAAYSLSGYRSKIKNRKKTGS